MPIQTEKLPEENIILATYTNPYKVADSEITLELLGQLLPEMEGGVFLVVDASQLSMNFSDLVQGLATVASNQYGKILAEKRLRIAAVVTNKILEFGTKALSQLQYGGLKVEVFNTLDDALVFARSELRSVS